jgi:hypothetical protein
MDKEVIYQALNNILETLESGNSYEAKAQLEGLINEIKYGIYD